MEASGALAQLRGRLEDSFGRGLATMIIASASNAADVSTIGIDATGFVRLAEKVSADQRVVDMWGTAGASDALAQWRQLV
ncbi:MAG: hypothetical protein U1E26_09520 [Coriobacteriia bacterium]|nr:hypothetical protein [Coriobacteriia bacterium]